MTPDPAAVELARQVHDALLSRGETVAVAESLTGGLLGATITAVPGVSATFRGGVVAYATDVKSSVLGVDAEALALSGPVDRVVAGNMASGVRILLQASYGLATTGVAGPDPQDGHPPGEVHLGLAGGGRRRLRVRSLQLEGDRAGIRAAAVVAALAFLRDTLAEDRDAAG